MPVSVVCVLRVGGEYTTAHVSALYEQVAAWWPSAGPPLRFVCLTNALNAADGRVEWRQLRYTWPGWWSKMELMLGEHDDLGDVLYMDLDTMIVGPLHPFTVARPLTLLEDFYKPGLAQSGLMWLPQRWRAACAAMWLDTPQEHMKQYRGDGEWLHTAWGHSAERWQRATPNCVASYKVHVQRAGTVPFGVRILCFHGHPRPWQSPLWAQRSVWPHSHTAPGS